MAKVTYTVFQIHESTVHVSDANVSDVDVSDVIESWIFAHLLKRGCAGSTKPRIREIIMAKGYYSWLVANWDLEKREVTFQCCDHSKEMEKKATPMFTVEIIGKNLIIRGFTQRELDWLSIHGKPRIDNDEIVRGWLKEWGVTATEEKFVTKPEITRESSPLEKRKEERRDWQYMIAHAVDHWPDPPEPEPKKGAKT